MAIYNPILSAIVAGNGITFKQNAAGAIVISTSSSMANTSTLNAVARFSNTTGGLQNSGVTIDDASNLSCASLLLNSNNANYIQLNSATGLTASVTYTMPSTIGDAGNLLVINAVNGSNANLAWSTAAGSGFITTVNGAPGRITVGTGVAPEVDISSSYIGQSSITTVGTINSGTWNGYVIASNFGGTGINNNGNTITLGGNLSTSGAYTTNINVTANTNVTLPTSGTLATTAQLPSFPLSASNGGTGQTSLTANAILIGNGTSTINFLSSGTNGQVLTSAGPNAAPVWSPTAITGVTSIVGVSDQITVGGTSLVPIIGIASTFLGSYSTTTQMNTAISNALTPYATTASLGSYSTTSQMNNAISSALTPYSTTSQMNSVIASALTPYATTASLGSYSTTSQMNSAISSALSPYSTTANMNNAISSALSSYSTTTNMNSAISSALSPYSTTSQVNSELANYAPLSNPIFSSSNIYFLSNGNGGWSFSYSSTGFNLSLNNVVQALSINNSGILTVQGIAGYSNTSQMNSAISSALTPYATIASLGSYSTTSQMNNAISSALSSYSTTSQMNTAISNALTPYATTASLGSYSTTSQMNSAISSALSPYSNTSQMNSAISSALSPYATTSQMNSAISSALSPYATTTNMNNAISSALSSYSTTTNMNNAISSALSPYSTTTQVNSIIANQLSNYPTFTQSSLLSLNFITFLVHADFSSRIFNCPSIYNAYIVDVTNADSPNDYINLPNNLANGQYIYFQFTGTANLYSIAIRDANYNSIVYNSSGAWQTIGVPGVSGTTYKLTYYTSPSNNPWWHYGDTDITTNNWQMQSLPSNYIPLSNNVNCYVIYTRNNSLTGYVSIPSSLNFGQQLYLKDGGGFMNVSRIQISAINSIAFDGGATTYTMSSANQSVHFVYTGGGTGGNLFTI